LVVPPKKHIVKSLILYSGSESLCLMSPPRTVTSSYSRSSRPVRAAPSTLSSRAAPSIPPSSEGYEPLVRDVLRRRLTRSILPHSFALSWALTVPVVGLGRLLMPSTLVWAVLRWAVGAMPIIMLRKVYLTGEPLHLKFTGGIDLPTVPFLPLPCTCLQPFLRRPGHPRTRSARR
jgi:hypothetical protein